MSQVSCAIVGGTGIYQLPGLELRPEVVDTPFGSAHLQRCQGRDLVFLTRHGADHSIPPHLINYRANMSALKILGVKRVLATYAVGSLRRSLPPGGLCLLTDFIDFTRGRISSFFEGGRSGLGHTDMSQPYCPELNHQLLDRATARSVEIQPQGVYACTQGPRFESAAEIRMMAQLGCDVVGMTGLPEVALAKELGMHFAGVALSINLAVGMEAQLTVHYQGLEKVRKDLLELFIDVLDNDPLPTQCACGRAVEFLHRPDPHLPPGYPQP